MKLLSILICTIPSRNKMFNILLKNIEEQISKSKYKDLVEVAYDDSVGISVGKKRNLLLDKAQGKFVVYIDDDDEVHNEYVDKICICIDNNPDIDCIAINGLISFDGKDEKKWFISKLFGKWYESNGIYYRTPNHISPIRRDIANQVRFPEINHGEDFSYSVGVLKYLHKEAKIDTPLYHYKFIKPYAPPSSNEPNHPYRPAFR